MEDKYWFPLKSESGISRVQHIPYELVVARFRWFMMAFGLVYTTDSNSKWSVSKVVHLLLTVLIWLNVLRYFGAYSFGEKFDIPLLFKFMIHANFLWAASSMMAGGKSSRLLPVLYQHWATYLKQHRVKYSEQLVRKQTRRARRALIASIILLCFIFVGNASNLISPTSRRDLQVYTLPFYEDCTEDGFGFMSSFVVVVMTIYLQVIVDNQLAYFLLLILGIRDEFTHFNGEFKSRLVPTKNSTAVILKGDLEYWRQRHAQIITLVKYLDSAYGAYVLLVFTSNIPVCCCLVYVVVMGQYELVTRLVIWAFILPTFVVVVGILFVITYCGTLLNTESVKCKSYLYSMDLDGDEWTAKKRFQFTAFYQKVTEGRIGITGWNLFYIDKTTVKMVIFLIITYSVMLLKFGKSSTAPLYTCGQPSDVTLTNLSRIAEE